MVILGGIVLGVLSLIIETGIYCLKQDKQESVDMMNQEYNQRHAQSVTAGSVKGVELKHYSNEAVEGSEENIARSTVTNMT